MHQEEQLREVTEALGLPPLLPAIYNDLVSPAARELGGGLVTIARAVKIALAPIEATVWCYDRVRQWLSLRVTDILADRNATDIIPPPLSVSVPLTLQMIFASGESDLREMYASLLASAMDARSAGTAHPSFVGIIQQLTADEARIINRIASLGQEWPSWHGKADASRGSDNDLWEQFRKLCQEANIERPKNVEVYVENLIRLRLLRHMTWAEAKYHPAHSHEHGDAGPDVTTEEYEFIELSAYGRGFIDACLPRTQSGTQPVNARDLR